MRFPPDSLGYSEGFIIRVRCSFTEAWIGNFRQGQNDHNAIYKHPDGKRLIVIAGGAYYLVDPLTKDSMGQKDNISFSCEVPELGIVVLGDHVRFWAEGNLGRAWTTPRLSWDGFTGITVAEDILTGKWYSAIDEEWREFRLNLSSGDVLDATFETDFIRVRPISRI